MYANISHGLHENSEFIVFFILRGTISIFINNKTTLTAMIIRIPIPNACHNNSVQNMKKVRNKIDSFNRR